MNFQPVPPYSKVSCFGRKQWVWSLNIQIFSNLEQGHDTATKEWMRPQTPCLFQACAVPLINRPNSGFAHLCSRVTSAVPGERRRERKGPANSQEPGCCRGLLSSRVNFILSAMIESHFTSFDKAHFAKMAKLNYRAVRRAQTHHSGPYQL